MNRLTLALGGVAALVAAALAGALWLRVALDGAFARGRALGQADIAARMQTEIAGRRAASDVALARSNADVAALEQARDALQERLDEVQRRSGVGRDRACLDAGVVRALGRIGRDRPATGARP